MTMTPATAAYVFLVTFTLTFAGVYVLLMAAA